MVRQRIGTRLMIGFLTSAAITLIVGAVAIYALVNANSTATATNQIDVQELSLHDRFTTSLANARRYEKEFFLFSEMGDPAKQQEYRDKLRNAWAGMKQEVAEFAQLPAGAASLEHAGDLANSVALCSQQIDELTDLMMAGTDYEAAQPEYQAYRSSVHDLEDLATGMSQDVLAAVQERQESLISTQATFETLVIAIMAAATVVAVVLGVGITRSITRPLNEFSKATARIAGGDLSQRVEVVSRDEFGELASSFNAMTESLQRADSEVKLKTRELEDANEALQSANEELTTTLHEVQELGRSNTDLEQFAYVASHDLQEPLRMVTSFVQLLARQYQGRLDADADEYIGYAVDGAARMQTLINDLLTYSRVGTHGSIFQPTDCEAVLNRAVQNLQASIDEAAAVVTHDPLPTLTADTTQLVQLLQNLIGNAIKFRLDEQPRVHVSARQQGNDWVFAVRDNGIGIDPEFKERIFLVFHRLHGRGEYAGTGIGLAVCKKIVERHGGRIWVESETGQGATFFFTIPESGGNET